MPVPHVRLTSRSTVVTSQWKASVFINNIQIGSISQFLVFYIGQQFKDYMLHIMELQNVFEVRRLIILIAYEVPIMCLRKATGSGYKTWEFVH